MADTYHRIASTGEKKKTIEFCDGTYGDAVYIGPRKLGTEVIVAGTGAPRGALTAPTNGVTVYARHEPADGHDIEWRVSSDVVHTVQLYRARSIVDAMTITLSAVDDGDTATINDVTYTAEDTATDALRSAHKYYTGGADDTADAVQLAAGINRGAYITVGTVAVADTVTIGNGVDDYTFTAAATEVIPSGVFHQSGTTTEDAVSLALCINHKDTVTFTSDATSLAATNPATNDTTELYALADEVMEDLIVHIANTAFHTAATGTITHTNATTEATAVAEVNLIRTGLLAHLASSTLHGVADTTNYATVAATSACTTKTNAVTLINALAAAYLAHIALAVPTATDTVTINNGISSTTFTAHAATTTVASHVFSVAGTDSQNGDELVSCINDRATITVATCVAGDSVTVNGITYYGKTGTAVSADHRFSVDTDDTACALDLSTLINDQVDGVTATPALGVITLIPDYGTSIVMSSDFATITCKDAAGVEGITAVNASGVVSLTRNSADYTVSVTTANGAAHPHNCATVATARGVPGVLATSNAAEVDIAPTWIDGQDITIVTSSDTMTWGRYGIPGVTATSALGVVTVVPKSTNGATCLESVTGTAAGEWAVAYTTLTGLIKDGDVVTDAAANSTTAGTLYTQDLNGYEYGYLGLTNKSGAGAMTCIVGATDH